ncbi:hypothetical protein LR48_Vigan53s001000 [Vigna angularis]|uniref:Putative plant transposon protein domain-containing protein n=1 Tax=Phaseolus angularis TaxID=3914 RepID=A0A0L9T3L3_PHAAN|nr:hypothetical protein LR48_Vigan53s001000 [Vigna angularis]
MLLSIRPHLTPLEKYWMAFTHASIQSCSHVSNITIQRAIFLYCVLRGLTINIGHVIVDEIQSCARGASSKAPLGHPSLITHLCEIWMSQANQCNHHSSLGYTREHHHQPRSQFMRSLLFRCGTCTFLCWMLDWLSSRVAWPADPTQEGGRAGAAEASTMDEDVEDEDDEDEEAEEDEDSDDDE